MSTAATPTTKSTIKTSTISKTSTTSTTSIKSNVWNFFLRFSVGKDIPYDNKDHQHSYWKDAKYKKGCEIWQIESNLRFVEFSLYTP